jgi:hypothetical protein
MWRIPGLGRPRDDRPLEVDPLAAIDMTSASHRVAVDRLGVRLLKSDRPGEFPAGLDVVKKLARHPALLIALDRAGCYTTGVEWGEAARRRFEAGEAGAIATVLASMHRSGHVRQAAVEAMCASDRSRLLPYVALRAADWVPQVRDPARAGLALPGWPARGEPPEAGGGARHGPAAWRH